MKIGILIFTREIKDTPLVSYETKRLIDVGRSRGHDVQILFEPLFVFGPDDLIQYDGTVLDQFDIILARPAIIDEPSLHTVTVDLLKNAGYHIVNGMPTFSVSKNKLAQAMVFDREQIPHPRSIIVRHPKNAAAAADQIGYPVIIKVAFGTHGKGVFIAKDLETLQPIVDYLNIRDGNPVILQEYIKPNAIRDGLEESSNGSLIRSDIRILVVGNNIIASMERVATGSDFRTNGHLDAKCRAVEISDQERELALQATKAFDLEIAGVDLIRSDRGPLVLEINSCPGFEQLEKATSVDVACAVIEYFETLLTDL
ncbi:MAG: RimK family alpha-L-glutamate ligase [Candidatus Uhrbacteria bacterium]